MGCSLPALVRILARNRFCVDAAYWPECLVDLLFAAGNSALGAVQGVVYRRALANVQLSDDPVFIVGHWRTGTTLLHELLALDPRLRAPTNYECLAPNHFLITARWLTGWTSFTLPRTRPPDSMQVTWDSPQEDEFALCNLGVPSPYARIAFPNEGPQSWEYLDLDSLGEVDRRRWEEGLLSFFKQLNYARPGRLVLKSPTHTFRVPTLTRMFPKSKWINIVRNPFAVFSSTVRLWRSLNEAYGYQKPRYEGLEEEVLETFVRMHARLEATRRLVEAGGMVDVRYEELVREPVTILRRVYRVLELGNLEVVQPAVERYLAERSGYVPSRHGFDPQFADEIRTRWKPYFERYGYSLDDGAVIGKDLLEKRELSARAP
jgi:hypothetical protein